ncbi:MAG: RMD1 family protein [Gammaproteobacteria bacterium]|nr:RMD1 family protein [Gammaproteobacteria bacterium]
MRLLDVMSQKISIRAWFLGSRLDIRELDRARLLAHSPVTLKTGPDEWVVAFRFGVVVLFGHKIRQEEQMLKTLEGYVSGAFSHPESEEAELLIDADLKDTVNHEGHIVVIDKSPERLQIIAQILAKSVVLAHYEKAVATTFERFENLVEQLRDGLSPGKGRAVIHEVGNALAILTRTVAQEVTLATREHRCEIVNHSETLLSFQIEREKCVKGINSAIEPRSIDS